MPMKVMGGIVMTAMSNLSSFKPMSMFLFPVLRQVSMFKDQKEEHDKDHTQTTISWF